MVAWLVGCLLMAISLVGSAVAAGASQGLSVAKPAGTALGDRVYIIISHNDETVTVTDSNPSTPTVKQADYPAQSGGSGGFGIFYRTAGGAEPASYAFTLTNAQRWVAIAITLRGMGSAAFEVVPATGIVTGTTTPTCPGITTTTDNAWVFAVASVDNAINGTFTAVPAGYTEVVTENTQQPTSVAYKVISPAGSVAAAAFTKTSAGTNDTYTLSQFAVAPAAGGGGTSWVGIYWTEFTLGDIPALAARGVTRFQVYGSNSTFNDAVAAVGGKVWVELSQAFSGTSGYNATTLQNIVNAVDGHAAVEGYLSNDEADLKGYSVANLQTAYTDIKAISSKPVGLVLRYPFRTSGPNGRQYVDATGPVTFDVCMPDPYIIPFGPASQVGGETAATVAVCGGRAVHTVIQSFSWGTTYGPKQRPDCYPTVAEMTEMGVSARENGAANLWIYTWSGDVETDNNPMSNFNAPCYAALADITQAWRAIGATASHLPRMLAHYGLTGGAL